MTSKKWYESRTIRFNIVILAIGIATALADPSVIRNPEIVQIAGLVVTIGNVILRFYTSIPINNQEG